MVKSRNSLLDRRIYHQRFGYGLILDVRRGGREYYIEYESTPLKMWLSSSEVILIDSQGLGPVDVEGEISEGLEKLISDSDKRDVNIEQKISIDSETYSAKKMIEAFRLGVVPYEEIDNFTFNREKETKQVFKALNEVSKKGGVIRVVKGEYGTGKSHFLEFIKQRALNEGWVVARTEFDPFEVKPQNPKAVYHALLVSLQAKNNGSKNLTKILAEATAQSDIYRKFKDLNHPYFSRLFEILRYSKSFDKLILWQWFLGDQINIPVVRDYCRDKKLPSLLPYYSSAPIVCNILGGLSVIAKMMGYKGLLLIIDEAESIANIQGYYIEKAENFILGLKLAVLGSKRSKLSNKDLVHPTRGVDLNYVFSDHSYLATIFAMTPRPAESETILEKIFSEKWIIHLNTLSQSDFLSLIKSLVDIYQVALPSDRKFSINQMKKLNDYIFQRTETRFHSLRLMIKFVIEILDILRYYPDLYLDELLLDEDDPFSSLLN